MYSLIKLHMNKEIKSYLFGFLFSIILTCLSFLVVIEKIFSHEMNYFIVLFLAVIQIIIHFLYFLHLNFSAEGKWKVVTLLFIMIIIFIVFFGSIWIMSNLNHHL
ncbi:cytochrome o ubiquinol oxidase subunit IV [Buchnera aphidicola (Hyadaphis tataricae)]|uniref:Cytochrome bo(3) ubiquinol oxidase subunit 4 n=1 Tax=Buchnera aphidicola (Hyadaphis tataricae) TaxID=1241859 RepID=A0A4D6XZU8_9GAMM|nr:cytochrome o ubiquinol oxidase subunit IV [Buchnera aphidicola]QCI21749.1 cytochrome o ubiquinol oxidase subunit IV [Buchnera aphidicola (Hyadaphis tataricae)]